MSSQKEHAEFITWHFDTIDIILKSDSLIIIDNGFRNNRDEISIKDDCTLSIFSFYVCIFGSTYREYPFQKKDFT